jgi:hypothetical protein
MLEPRLLDAPCVDCGGEVFASRSDRVRCDDCRRRHNLKRGRTNKSRQRAKNPELARAVYRRWQLAKTYGLTVNQYEELLSAQGGVCATCLTNNPGSKDWHVDHDHATGRVRGLLCANCNLTLGKVGDSVETLERMISYMKGPGYFRPNIKEVLGL